MNAGTLCRWTQAMSAEVATAPAPTAEANADVAWAPLSDDTTKRNDLPLTQRIIEKQTVAESIDTCHSFGQFSVRKW